MARSAMLLVGSTPLIYEEGKEVLPVGQGTLGPGYYQGIGAVEKDRAILPHALAYGRGIQPQLLPGTA